MVLSLQAPWHQGNYPLLVHHFGYELTLLPGGPGTPASPDGPDGPYGRTDAKQTYNSTHMIT